VLKRYLLFITVLFIVLYGCIERYFPDEEEIHPGTLVVVAQLNNIPGYQSILISRSTSLNNYSKDPVVGCLVQIEKDDGVCVDLNESEPGEYGCFLEAEFLTTGASYRLHFITPQSDQYESEFEILNPASEIDSVYYFKEDRPTSDPSVTEEGIRFYIDFEIEKDSARYLLWQLVETYEYHLPDYRTRMYGVDRLWYDVSDSEKWLQCWITREIPGIFTLDLGNVEGNIYQKMPLNYVSSETQRLHHRYSMLVRQLSLSEKAFWYWNELGKNVQLKGSLFDTQPALTPSNICNVEDESELIIGFFSITGGIEKRIFVDEVPGLHVFMDPSFCAPGVFPMFLHRYPRDRLPLYVAYVNLNGAEQKGKIEYDCVDCREQKGGSIIKPEFW